jgi:hypothetical protein
MDNESPKLLVVADNGLPPKTAEYALKVAVRLDLEIIVLFIDEESTWEDTAQHRSKVELFEAKVEKEAASFTSLAWKSSINVTTIVDVDDREAAISRISEQDEGIRFILSGRTEDQGGNTNDHPRLTVIRPA